MTDKEILKEELLYKIAQATDEYEAATEEFVSVSVFMDRVNYINTGEKVVKWTTDNSRVSHNAVKELKEVILKLIKFVEKEGRQYSRNAYSMGIGRSVLSFLPKMRKIANIE